MAGQHLAVVTDRVFAPKTRAWAYTVALAVIGVLIGYGILDQAHAGLWALLVGAVLGIGTTGLALANVPTVTTAAAVQPAAVQVPAPANPGAPAIQAGPGTALQQDTAATPADATPAG